MTLIDAKNRRFDVATNCVGNFFVQEAEYTPTFPVTTSVAYGALIVASPCARTSVATAPVPPVARARSPTRASTTSTSPRARHLPSERVPMMRRLAIALFFSVSALFFAGCVDVESNEQFHIALPSEDQFTPVGLYLDHRCGSLDCHGQTGRNLKLYGQEGLRLDPTGLPGGGPTTMDELADDYRSVVGLEPELMTSVVEEHGKDPERLSLVAKPVGLQDHKGGKLFSKGSEQFNCITSWLAGAVDMTACADGTASTP